MVVAAALETALVPVGQDAGEPPHGDPGPPPDCPGGSPRASNEPRACRRGVYPKPPVTGVTGVTRVTNPITMGILAVTRAAETCDRCDDLSHACRGGGLSVGRPATVSRARQKC